MIAAVMLMSVALVGILCVVAYTLATYALPLMLGFAVARFAYHNRLRPDRRELHRPHRRRSRVWRVFGSVCQAAVADPASHRGAGLRRPRRHRRLRAGPRRDLRGDSLCNLATNILLRRRGARRPLGADAFGRQQLREKDRLRLVFLVGLTTLLPEDGAKGSRYGFVQLEGQWKSLDAERVAFLWGVALRAALSAAPEPRLRRVSAIRLQSLTQEGGGCGHLAPGPSSHSSLRGLASIPASAS